MRTKKAVLKAVTFFSGIEGLGKGLAKAGFTILMATDIWDKAKIAWENNLPGKHSPHLAKHLISEGHYFIGDMFDADYEDKWMAYFKKCNGHTLKPFEIDLVAGGPPCQETSILSRTASQFGELNELIFMYLKFALNKIKPKALVMEQVPWMLSRERFEVLGDRLKGLLNSYNEEYLWKIEVLNAADYGSNQERERMILIMVHRDYCDEIIFPEEMQRTRNQLLCSIVPSAAAFTPHIKKNEETKWIPSTRIMNTLTASGGEFVKRTDGSITKFTLDELLDLCELRYYNLCRLTPTEQHRLLGNMVLISFAELIGKCVIDLLFQKRNRLTMMCAA